MFNKFKSLFRAQDLTVGKPMTCLLKFAIPLLIGNFAQMLYSTVDAVVVGKYVGDAALAAIGVSTPIQSIFLVIFISIGAGVTVMVAQYFGAKEYDNLAVSIGNSITLIAMMSVFIPAVAIPISTPLLNLLQTPAETFDMSRTYLVILFAGAVGNGFYNIMSGILRGLGESVFPLIILLCTSALNIVLDIWFVAGLNMGIAGAAWATIISQCMSATVCLLKVLMIRNIVRITPSCLRLKKRIVFQIIRLGVPTGVSNGIMFVGVLVVQALVNRMGYLVTAAITAMFRIDGFAVLPSQTYSMAASTFTGQNIGAGDMERVKRGSRSILVISLITAVIMVTFMMTCGRTLMGFFSDTEELITMGMGFIKIMSVAYFTMAIHQCYAGVMRGAGDAMGPMWISIIMNIVLRIPFAYLIAHLTVSEQFPHGNPDSIFTSMVIASISGMIITLIYFKAGKWRSKAITGKLSAEGAESSAAKV